MDRLRVTWRQIVYAAVVLLVVTACGSDDNGDTAAVGSGDGEPVATEDSDWDPEWVDGVLQPLPSGFPDSTISLFSLDQAGSDDGIYARHLQAAISDLSPVRIEVVDRPDFGAGYGTWEALRYAENESAGREGYILTVSTHVGVVTDLLEGPLVEELNVTIDDLNWIITTEQSGWLILSRDDAPWGTDFEAFIEYARDNPGEVRYLSRGPGSGLSLGFTHYANALGIEVNEIVSGSTEEINIALGAGAGDVAINQTGVSVPFIESGRVHVLACSGNITPCPGGFENDPPSVASIAGLELDPWAAIRGLLVPTVVPDAHRDWLGELVRAGLQDEQFRQVREAIPGLALVDWGPEESFALDQVLYDSAYQILDEEGLLDESLRN